MAWLIRYYSYTNTSLNYHRKEPLSLTRIDEDVDAVAYVYYRSNDNPEYTAEELIVKLSDEYFDEKKARRLLEILQKKLEENEGSPLFTSAYDAFKTLVDALVELEPPYTTPGIEVRKFKDTGGDYPNAELEFVYFA